MLITATISGLVLGGTYALVAMGLTLQYGIARIMNLAYGELTILAALATFLLFSIGGINPILAMAVILPAGFVLGYGIYAVMISPLAKRSASSGALEVDSILASFGLLFVIQGIMLIGFGGGNYISYNFMNFGVDILGATIAANRLLAFAIAVILGLATLRLAGVYFVIFTFGLAELIRQLVAWYEVNFTGVLGRYVFLPISPTQIYWQLLGLGALTLAIGWWIGRSRLGLALRVIGDDETAAQHMGIDIARAKLGLFALSAVIITLVGAIQAPRWVYIEPAIVFNPMTSFLTLIMALVGGASRLWGPLLGAIPLFLLFEWLSVNFPNHYPILLGLAFIAVVFVLPRGVIGFVEERLTRSRARQHQLTTAKTGA